MFSRLYLYALSIQNLPMADLKQDDYTEKVYKPEDEQTYTIEVKTKRPFEDGKERTERLYFEVTHSSFMEIIGKKFEGKKILNRWQHWENPSDETLKKYPKARGKWVYNKV